MFSAHNFFTYVRNLSSHNLVFLLYISRISSKYKFYKNDFYKCKMCNRFHALNVCPKFLKMTPKERNLMILKNSYCVNCLARSHRFRDCRSRHTCRKCGRYHHTMLHPIYTQTKQPQKQPQQKQTQALNGQDDFMVPNQYILSEAIRSLASVLCASQESTNAPARRHVQSS